MVREFGLCCVDAWTDVRSYFWGVHELAVHPWMTFALLQGDVEWEVAGPHLLDWK